MTASELSFVRAAAGGALIGVSASALLIVNGRIAGVSGVLGGAIRFEREDLFWRLAFIAGLLAGGAIFALAAPALLPAAMPRGPLWIALAGLLVGYGTRLGNGCTSGHGVCGVGRLSPRSMVATATFIVTGMIAATALAHFVGIST